MKVCSKCGKPYSGDICTSCNSKRAKFYNQYDRDSIFTYGHEWETVSQMIRSMDKGLCRMCLKENKFVFGKLVHHIVPVKEDSSLWYDPDNLITLCDHHHRMVHALYDKGHTKETQAMLKELVKGREMI